MTRRGGACSGEEGHDQERRGMTRRGGEEAHDQEGGACSGEDRHDQERRGMLRRGGA